MRLYLLTWYFSWFIVLYDHYDGDFLLKLKVTETGHHVDYKHIFIAICRAFLHPIRGYRMPCGRPKLVP